MRVRNNSKAAAANPLVREPRNEEIKRADPVPFAHCALGLTECISSILLARFSADSLRLSLSLYLPLLFLVEYLTTLPASLNCQQFRDVCTSFWRTRGIYIEKSIAIPNRLCISEMIQHLAFMRTCTAAATVRYHDPHGPELSSPPARLAS